MTPSLLLLLYFFYVTTTAFAASPFGATTMAKRRTPSSGMLLNKRQRGQGNWGNGGGAPWASNGWGNWLTRTATHIQTTSSTRQTPASTTTRLSSLTSPSAPSPPSPTRSLELPQPSTADSAPTTIPAQPPSFAPDPTSSQTSSLILQTTNIVSSFLTHSTPSSVAAIPIRLLPTGGSTTGSDPSSIPNETPGLVDGPNSDDRFDGDENSVTPGAPDTAHKNGQIIGAVIGVALFVGLVIAACAFRKRRKRQQIRLNSWTAPLNGWKTLSDAESDSGTVVEKYSRDSNVDNGTKGVPFGVVVVTPPPPPPVISADTYDNASDDVRSPTPSPTQDQLIYTRRHSGLSTIPSSSLVKTSTSYATTAYHSALDFDASSAQPEFPIGMRRTITDFARLQSLPPMPPPPNSALPPVPVSRTRASEMTTTTVEDWQSAISGSPSTPFAHRY